MARATPAPALGATADDAGRRSLPLRLLPLLPLAAAAAIPALTGNLFHFHIAILVCINIVATAGLAVIARVGQLSLCHGAFVGIGAYASMLMVMRLDMPFILGLAAAILVTAAISGAIGGPILRLRGVYFVLITFALNELFRLVMLEFPEISGGSSGIPNIPPASLGPLTFSAKPDFYILALIAAALAMGVLALIDRGLIGRKFKAVEENLPLAEASGIPTGATQNLAFVIGSTMAGFAGALMAHYIGFISPESFNFHLSVAYIVMLVVGGRLAFWGPVVGALILTPLPELLRGALEYQHVLYGVALIAILQFLPGGLVSLPDRLRRLAGGRP